MTRPLRALITNDDGIGSEGLRQLAVMARDRGLQVVVAAPREEASGSGAALTAVEAGGRVVVEPRTLEGLDGVPCHAVAGAPAFIAMIACRGAFGPPPDIVLSGINRGANTGRAIIHSGTVGAALTASLHGRRALAVSIAGHTPVNWATASRLAERVLSLLLHGRDRESEHLVLNLNVPDAPLDRLPALRSATLARFGAVQTSIAEVGEGWVRLGMEQVGADLDRGSDAALLAAGHATVTSVTSVGERAGLELPPDGDHRAGALSGDISVAAS